MKRKAYLRPAGYVLFFLFLVLVFSVLNYPGENLAGTVNNWLSEASDHVLSVESVSFKPVLSLKLGGIAVDTGKDRQTLGDAVISPAILALLTGKKAAKGRLDGPWASSRFKIQSKGDSWKLDVDSLKVKLDTFPFPEDLPLKLSGEAEASLDINILDPSNIRLEGQGKFTGTDIQVFGEVLEALGLSPLRFPSLSVFFTIENNVLTLNENNLAGDISAAARGNVRLVPAQPGNSRLSLSLDVKPGAQARERLSPFYSLIGVRPKTDGSFVLKIRGTIDRPSITS